MPTVIFVESVFIKSSISGVITPRGTVRVPSTSKRAMMRGFAGAIVVVVFALLVEIGVVDCQWKQILFSFDVFVLLCTKRT